MEIRAEKRFRSKAERRQIVEETMKPDASVSQVARAHAVNANQGKR
jgi:transposase-like protein